MGFRFRKSINLGGGFRVNLSKSGIGYSWGTKGFRVTKKAGGGTRKTFSIPGTGLSWVEESGGKKKTSSRKSDKQQLIRNTRELHDEAPNCNGLDDDMKNESSSREDLGNQTEMLRVACDSSVTHEKPVENISTQTFDASSEERYLMDTFMKKLNENNLSVAKCNFIKTSDGTIEVFYKGTNIGKINLVLSKTWLEYPIGNSGKTKRVVGTNKELFEKTSNWIRYIINYM